ncbi:MAG: DNA polymerase III subunit gamma/tau [Saprospiraceae bacterium]|nr:DNA polymerase III subunit gamma/tau [Saprospiraceae bacterium]
MSQFIVSARKYRPLRFDDVVGQEHVSKTLKNAIRQNTLAHAFLFCGPRGVGKTTCARILAKVLNCKNVTDDLEPCNQCDSCLSFDRNASLNIIELDAASNNSVEHIRSLNEQVRFQPQEGTYKVFIIDEVHMLSSAAFNAFLKTLEEPPSYAIFILATTEKHKIIPTILSRCQIFDFRRIRVDDIVGQLKYICDSQGIVADDEALHLIATKSDGALRDALSIFDKLASFGGKQITYQDVISNLNILDYDYFFKVVDAMLLGDIAEVLRIFDEIQQKGFEADAFLNGLAEHFRNLLVCHHQAIHHLLELSEQVKATYLRQAKLTEESFLLSALDIANDCDVNYRMAKNKRLHVEMALIKMNFINQVVKSPDLLVEKNNKVVTEKSATSISRESKSVSGPRELSSVEMLTPTNGENNKEISSSSQNQSKRESTNIAEARSDQEDQIVSQIGEGLPFNIKKKQKGPGLNSLSHYVKAVEKKFEETRELQSQVVSLDQVQSIWNEYAESQNSQTVKAVLLKTKLDVVNNSILATVGSMVSKSVILQEVPLIEDLRAKLGLPRLTIRIDIDEANIDTTERPKLLTTKEKYEHMCNENPQLTSFLDRFGLKPDNDV